MNCWKDARWKPGGFLPYLLLITFLISLVGLGSAETLTVDYSFDRPEVIELTIDEVNYHRIVMPGVPCGGDIGSPALPARGARILIPCGQQVDKVEIVPGEKTLLGTGYMIEPVGAPVALSVDPREYRLPTPNLEIYSRQAPFPKSKFKNIGVQSFRGYQILFLRLEPVEYLPTTGELWYYADLKVIVSTSPSQKRATLYRGLSKDKAEAEAKVDNPTQVSTYATASKSGAENFDLMIITSPGMETAFQPLKDYHDSTGIATEIFTNLDIGGFTPEIIRDFIREKYLNNGVDYVLIGDDDAMIPARRMYIQAQVYDQGYATDFSMPSDLYYACLDGTFDGDGDGRYGEPTDGEGGGDVDLVAEVYVGRATVDNVEDVTRFVNKTIQYLSSSGPYLNKALVCSEDLYYPGAKHYGYVQMEELIDGASTHGYTTTGFPSDLYTMDKMYDYYWPGSWLPSDLYERVENGVQIVNHLGHCNYEYALRLTPVDAILLANEDPCFIYTQGCYAGGFDTSDAECMAEMLTVKAEHGAFAAIMNARYGWCEAYAHPSTADGASQRFNREFWDAVFNPAEDKPELGRANQDSKEDNLYRINDGAMRWCYYQLNLFGDPSVAIKRPHGLTFDFPSGLPATSAPEQTSTIEVNVTGLYGGEPVAGSGQLHFSINDGELQTVAMTESTPNQYEGVLPGIQCGDTLAYYVSAEETASGRLYDVPSDSAHQIIPVARVITAFEDDFESDKGWNVSGGSWARGTPTGGGGEKGWPDPVSAYSADNVYGYNLNGDYENGLPARSLTSPAIDCSLLENVHLVFWRWLGVEHIPWDNASINIGTDGADWTTLWANPGIVQDSEWTEVRFDISGYAAYQPTVYLRWTMGPTNQIFHYCGWNIDDVRVLSYDCFGYYCGDANTDDLINVGDAVFLINYVFRGGDPPEPVEAGDANGDGGTNVGDAVYLISFIFKEGPFPKCP